MDARGTTDVIGDQASVSDGIEIRNCPRSEKPRECCEWMIPGTMICTLIRRDVC